MIILLSMDISKESTESGPNLRILSLKELEFLHIVHVMFHFSGNRTQVAKAIGFSIRTLRNKLNEYKEERQIVFPMTGCNTLNRAQFRHVFLTHNRLAEESFTFPEIKVAEQTIQVLVSDYGFPPYLMDRIKNDFMKINARFVDHSN